MSLVLQPWHILLLAVASLVNREQQQVIDYLTAENRVLREQLKGRRLRLTDKQRIRLAVAAKALGRKLLAKLDTLVTPDTLLRWHRELVARKYDGSAKRNQGRPRIRAELEALIVRMARENPRWGYTRIQGALANLGHQIARSTIANVLARAGIEPAPHRRTTWKQFLAAHWHVIGAADFFTVEVWRPVGLVRHHVLFVIELASRRVRIAGIIDQPYGAWMQQIARNLTDIDDGLPSTMRHLICDRDPLFTGGFRQTLRAANIDCVRLPPRSPILNAFAERFVLSIKSECLARLLLFSEQQLRTAVGEYVAHYHAERNHQGLGNRLIDGAAQATNEDGEVVREGRLGGLLGFYRRVAAVEG